MIDDRKSRKLEKLHHNASFSASTFIIYFISLLTLFSHICLYDIDECTEKPPCNLADENQICVNTPGNYECKCPPGYELNFEDRLCENVNECKLKDFDRCGENEHCIDNVGSYQCVCDEGFKFNKVLSSCEDINECDFEYSDVDPDLVMPTCDKRTSHCRNSPGSFYCKCKRGFKNLGDSDKLCTNS